MENKRKAMLVGIAGVIAVTLLVSLVAGAARNHAAEQPGEPSPEAGQEQSEDEGLPPATPEQEALALLVGSVWKSADGKATLTFKDGRYIETRGEDVEFATFDVRQVTAREGGFALTLHLDATKDQEAKDSLVVIAPDSKGVPTVSSDDFKLAQAYAQSHESRPTIAVAGVTEELVRLAGDDEAALVLAIEEYASTHVPGAKTAKWSGEVLLDFNAGSMTTTFSCDDPAKTLVTVMRSADGKFTVTG